MARQIETNVGKYGGVMPTARGSGGGGEIMGLSLPAWY